MSPIGEWESRERELGGEICLAARVTQKRHIARNWLRWNVPKERGSIVARFFTYGRYRPEKARGPSFKTAPFHMVMIEKHTKEVPRLNHPLPSPRLRIVNSCISWKMRAHPPRIYFEFHPTIKEKHVEENPLNRRNLRTKRVFKCAAPSIFNPCSTERSSRWKPKCFDLPDDSLAQWDPFH